VVNKRRAHFVPRTYLRAWADSDELLAYRRRGDNARPASVRNVAVVGGLYGLGELGDACEKMYQDVEVEWPNLRRDLIARGDLQDDQRRLFALFAALQLVRTEKHSEQMSFTSNVAATTADRPVPRDAVRDYLRDLWVVPSPTNPRWKPRGALSVGSPACPACRRPPWRIVLRWTLRSRRSRRAWKQ
jgi:Protein of unknown function (DUF4238)